MAFHKWTKPPPADAVRRLRNADRSGGLICTNNKPTASIIQLPAIAVAVAPANVGWGIGLQRGGRFRPQVAVALRSVAEHEATLIRARLGWAA